MAVDIRALLIKAVHMIDVYVARLLVAAAALGVGKDLYPQGNWNYRIATLRTPTSLPTFDTLKSEKQSYRLVWSE